LTIKGENTLFQLRTYRVEAARAEKGAYCKSSLGRAVLTPTGQQHVAQALR